MLTQQCLSDGLGRRVALSAPVTIDRKPISKEQPSEEREQTEQRWIQFVLVPLLWFVVGVALGGGFGDIRFGRRRRE
jgi:nitrate reductase NapE component